MLTINLIRERKDFIIERLKVKNFDSEEIINKILLLDSSRRDILSKSDQMQGELNRISKEIGVLMREGKENRLKQQRKEPINLRKISDRYQIN